MLRIRKVVNDEVILVVSGRVNIDNLSDLKGAIEAETDGRPVVLDLKDLTIVDRDAVLYLEARELDSIKIKFKNCPPYIRQWIDRIRETK
jgi:anti-anti-sigma regulatory factor